MNPIFRIISDDYPQLDWNTGNRNVLDLKRCHWGQLKLFYSELEFLTLVSKYYKLSECVLVYVGSAPGHHITFFRKIFPELHMILYDPAKFAVNPDEFIEIHTGKEGFFTDDSISEVLQNPKIQNKKILFISDIRLGAMGDEFEKNVFNDMLRQQKWGIMLNSEMMMIKCRFPYIDNKDVPEFDLNYDTSSFQDKITNIYDEKIPVRYRMRYLDGDIYLQISPNSYSTETRLIVRKSQTNGKYVLKDYDIKKYESQCFYYNMVDRLKEYEYKDSSLLKYNLAGFNDGYDRVSEFFICCEYFNHYLKQSYDFSKVVVMLFEIHKYLTRITHRDVATCEIRTILNDYVKKNALHRNLSRNNRSSREEIKKKLELNKNEKIKTLKEQIKYLANGKILSKSAYNEQIYQLKKDIPYIIDKTDRLIKHI